MNRAMTFNIDKRRVRRLFDRAAGRYDRLAAMQRGITSDLLALLSKDLQPRRIVDLGCGTGHAIQLLQQRYSGAHLTGLDLAESMLSQARWINTKASLVQGDIEQLPFADNQFDLVFSSSAIQWCGLHRALNEVSRITAPGGQVLISSFLAGTLRQWRELWMAPEECGQHSFRSLDELRNAASSAGLSVEHLESRELTQDFYRFEDAVASIRDLGAGNAAVIRQPGLMGRRKLQEIKNHVEELIALQGQFSLSYNVVLGAFRKPASSLPVAD